MGKIINLFNRLGDGIMESNNKTYNVMDIAQYVINKSNEINKPISNLKLQKILYLIQGEFLKTLDKPAFLEQIQAWKHGPVIPEVYYEFNKYIAQNITCKFDNFNKKIFCEKDRSVINKIIKDNSNKSAWELVEITHNQSPWKDNYKLNKNNIISIDDIKKYFCEKQMN